MIKEQVVNEIHKTARRNFVRRSVFLKGIDDLWQADLIDLKHLKTYNRGYSYILVVIDCFSKYTWTEPLKTKTKLEVANAFKQIIDRSNRYPTHLQTDKGTEFYNNTFEILTKSLSITHYSTFSTKKASIVERVIRTLKNRLFKSFSLNGSYKWIGKPMDDVVSAYNNTIHSITKFKPNKINYSNECVVKNNLMKFYNKKVPKKKKYHKFKVGDYVRISKYKTSFQKGYTPNWSTEIFKVKTCRNTNPVTYKLVDAKNNDILGGFYEPELQKCAHPNVYLIEKVIKRKGTKLFVKWLGLTEKENSWINQKEIVI